MYPKLTILMHRRWHLELGEAEELAGGAVLEFLAAGDSSTALELSQPEHEARLLSYLMAIATHQRASRFRRAIHETSDDYSLLRVVDPSLGPEEAMIAAENLRDLQAKLEQLRWSVGQLKEPYATVFLMLLHERTRLIDIARLTGRSPDLVYKQFQRGIAIIRNLMADTNGSDKHGHGQPDESDI